MDPALESPGSTPGLKRVADDGTPLPRAKRNRYISIACNECKRRKVKCNGNQPCQRCGNLNLECVYAPNCCGSSFKDSEEWRAMNAHIASLQEQVDVLFANVSSLRAELSQTTPLDPSLRGNEGSYPRADAATAESAAEGMLAAHHGRRLATPSSPGFRGPTSSDFGFVVAKHSLNSMGLTADVGHDDDRVVIEPAFKPSPKSQTAMHPSKDPIWSVSREEVARLLDIYQGYIHDMYPVVTLSALRDHTNKLYTFMEAMKKNTMVRLALPGSDALEDENTILLKMILATILQSESEGESGLGKRLFDSLQPHVDASLLGGADIAQIRLLAIAAMYYFHCDDEGTSWRLTGLTARLCVELGLHRKETYDKMSAESRDSAVLLFWSIYTLDRRWSFGTGMPFALQEPDIDPLLPRPGEKSLYLSAMIDFCSLSSKVWHVIGADTQDASNPITRDDIAYLDFQVRQWYENIPESLKFDLSSLDKFAGDHQSKGNFMRLPLVIYLRYNYMLISVNRPVLHSATAITKNPSQAQEVVNVAKLTIRVLTRFNQVSGVYRTNQIFFNAFLAASLAALFLAVSHAPSTFVDQVRDEFYHGLDLVRGFSKTSYISRRLWKTIKILKEIGPKFGLVSEDSNSHADGNNRDTTDGLDVIALHNAQHAYPGSKRTANGAHVRPGGDDDPSRSAALAMAGLAGHNVDELAMFGANAYPTAVGTFGGGGYAGAAGLPIATSPELMANDLTRLFEAAGSLDPGLARGDASIGSGSGHGEEGFGGEDEISRVMRELF